ncbi:phage capsid protein [Sphingomonas alpina]|uniref:Phage major capsid protein n=1 Tax=Sphingomonas alpina TaxID=653931 RepID=A0A7H0LHU8_9SPHN|nr:phage capsid protein [Sphingomonas alpina]QNQ09251.1 hypothetical protein H3Z74_21695 [Sphingomonas alpina]
MADNWAESLRTVEYRNNVTHELKQQPGILYPLAGSSDTYSSKSAEIEQRFAGLTLQKKTTRNGDTNNVDPSASVRFVKKPGSSNVAPLLDRDDKHATSVDMKSPLVMETADAVRAYHDDQFLTGWWGNGWTGETGDIAVPFTAGNKVAHTYGGGGSVGLTKAKLIELRRLLGTANVSMQREKPIILLDPDSESDLLNINEYVNKDFGEGSPLMTGEIKPWLGFRFFSVNMKDAVAFPNSAALFQVGGINRLPVIIPSGIHRGVWVEFFGKITERDDKQFSEQIYAEAESAVVRTNEAKAWFLETKPAA